MDRTSADTPGINPAGWTGSAVLDSLTNRCRVFLFSYSPHSRGLVSFSPNALEVLGVKDFTITGSGNLFLRHVHPDDRFRVLQDLEQAFRGEKEYRVTYRWIRPDTKEVRWLHCRGQLIARTEDALFEGMIVDLSDELRNLPSAAFEVTPNVIGALPGVVFTLDTELRIGLVSRPLTSTQFRFGDENFDQSAFTAGKPLADCFSSAELRARIERIALDLIEGKREEYHERFRAPGGPAYELALVPVKDNGICPGLAGVIIDVSAPAQLEDRVAQLERFEGVRSMLTGVSHHLNNALQGILGQADIIFHNAHRPEVVQQASNMILESAQRTSALSRLVFESSAAESGGFMRPCDLNVALMKALHGNADLSSGRIKVALTLGAALPILAPAAGLESLLTELLAFAAAQADSATPIYFKTFETTVGRTRGSPLKPGRYVELVVSQGPAPDNFRSSASPVREHADETARKIAAAARELGGDLLLANAGPGKVNAVLALPTALPGAATNRSAAEQQAEPPASATVLVVDDDLMVLETVAAILRDSGMQCLTASSSEAAVDLIRKHSGVDLVLVDALMPGTDGARLVKKLKRLLPELKVVGFSGAAPEYSDALKEAGAVDVLSKPLDPAVLKRMVRALVGGRAAA